MLWFDNPSMLLKNPTKFWPTPKDTQDDQINSASLFIIYGTTLAYFLKKEKNILVVGVLILVALFLFTKVRHVTPLATKTSEFNPDDPFGNFAHDRTYDKENVSKSMKKLFPEDTVNAERAFFSMPNDDMDKYLNFVHGGKKPFCRQDQSVCSADDNPMFMDQTQLRAVTNIPVFF